MPTVPLISAEALTFLMLMLPICLAALAPSRPPSTSPTAPVTFEDSAPVMLSVPDSGVAKVRTSPAPLAEIGPRTAVQLMSAFCNSCSTGLAALPAKLRGVPRSAASRIAPSVIATGAMMVEVRGAAGRGGNSTSTGAWPPGASQSIALRLAAKARAMTIAAIRMVLRRIIGVYRSHVGWAKPQDANASWGVPTIFGAYSEQGGGHGAKTRLCPPYKNYK